jgi:hypothetical protein
VSRTRRHEKREPSEREFPYIPVGVPVLQVGEPYGAADNAAYVRSLIDARYPGAARAYEEHLQDWECGPACKAVSNVVNNVVPIR